MRRQPWCNLFVATAGFAACGGSVASTDQGTTSRGSQTSSTQSLDDSSGVLSCKIDQECADDDPCNGSEHCSDQGVCMAGEVPVAPTPCGEGGLCDDGQCVVPECGNGIIEPTEQCDDGNHDAYDGCDDGCQYELFFRSYELTLMTSPAGSFCERPTSLLGDALNAFALEGNNAARKASIDTAVYNSLLQVVGLTDLSGNTDGTIEVRQATGILDPARGTWPDDGSNPLDWWFLVSRDRLADDGLFGDQIPDVSLSRGALVGGPGRSLIAQPQFRDSAIRARFDTSQPADTPAPPPGALAEGTQVPQELRGDGDDEGICGNLTVSFIAATPLDPGLAQCLECPGQSHVYTPCSGDVITADCNSNLDALVGGCVVGSSCEDPVVVITPSQPDVDHGGAGPLVNDENDHFRIPAALTEGNENGYSAYFRFRARRVHVTGMDP